jgi:hypothetical protein
MWIQTVMHMSGTRANGEKYPPGWTPFEVEDWEGEHLVRGGMAMEVGPPPKPPRKPVALPAPEPVREASPAAGALPPAGDDGPPAGQQPPPAPADPKQAWVDYAISQGMSPDMAAKMTKTDLQSRYGPRM